jgi:hypothetical protein
MRHVGRGRGTPCRHAGERGPPGRPFARRPARPRLREEARGRGCRSEGTPRDRFRPGGGDHRRRREFDGTDRRHLRDECGDGAGARDRYFVCCRPEFEPLRRHGSLRAAGRRGGHDRARRDERDPDDGAVGRRRPDRRDQSVGRRPAGHGRKIRRARHRLRGDGAREDPRLRPEEDAAAARLGLRCGRRTDHRPDRRADGPHPADRPAQGRRLGHGRRNAVDAAGGSRLRHGARFHGGRADAGHGRPFLHRDRSGVLRRPDGLPAARRRCRQAGPREPSARGNRQAPRSRRARGEFRRQACRAGDHDRCRDLQRRRRGGGTIRRRYRAIGCLAALAGLPFRERSRPGRRCRREAAPTLVAVGRASRAAQLRSTQRPCASSAFRYIIFQISTPCRPDGCERRAGAATRGGRR